MFYMQLKKIWQAFLFSFPIQLLLLQVKKNTWLVIIWLILFGFVFQQIGSLFGIPYLFLDPEYDNKVSVFALFIMGVSVGGFIISFHITSYIIDAHRFSFLGNVSSPFSKFCLNNSVLPIIFVLTYLICFIRFQIINIISTDVIELWNTLGWQILGFLIGIQFSILPIYFYFTSTNQDVLKLLAKRVNKGLSNPKIKRVNVMKEFAKARYNKIRVDNYFKNIFTVVESDSILMDLGTALKVLRQNRINGFIIQVFVFIQIVFLGIFRDNHYFQIPAAASLILLFTLIILFSGAIALWLGYWTNPILIIFFFSFNLAIQKGWFAPDYKAFGMDYEHKPAEYSLERMRELSSWKNFKQDQDSTIKILERWKAKFKEKRTKPRLVLICASGGGQRASVWTMRSLQYADSVLNGDLMKHTVLITGASGGLLGAGYFRELYFKHLKDSSFHHYNDKYLNHLAKDNLNSITFSLVVSDLLFKFQKFKYNGFTYYKDRGYAFEQQLNRNTDGALDKKISDYYEAERLAKIPLMIISPTIVNDGRKLYISPQNISYMTNPDSITQQYLSRMVKGIEFKRFFKEQNATGLRFLSALRMSATFPYITPNVTLPSKPEMEIMDAGLSDNFGVHDALRFSFVFRDWISKNTSGVILLSIRDSPRNFVIEANEKATLLQKALSPIGTLYDNWQVLQDYDNDNDIEFAQTWFKVKLQRIEFQYSPQLLSLKGNLINKKSLDSLQLKYLQKRASLSWRLTEREKQSLKQTIYEIGNQQAMENLKSLLK